MQKTNLLNKVTTIAAGAAYLGKELVDTTFDMLEKHDVLNMKEGKETAEAVKAQVKQTKTQVKKTVLSQLRGIVKDLGIATVEDVENLKANGAKTARAKKA